MNKLTPTFLFLGLALLLWISASSLSSHLANDLERKEHKKKVKTEIVVSEDIKSLQANLQKNPDDPDSYLKLADGLIIEAEKTSNSQLIMQAVDSLNKLLTKSPENPEALFRLAELCLQFGIIDKALEYYPRYLKQRPDDLSAKTNYGLSLLQGQQSAEAISIFNEILLVDSENFPALLSLALSHRMQGDFKKAEEVARDALNNAPDDAAKVKVEEFIASLSEQPVPSTEEKLLSPASKITGFFKDHPIIGPKISRSNWLDEKTYQLYLSEFPVDQMPPFAKQKLETKVKELLVSLGDGYKVILLDADNEKELLIFK